MRTGHVARASVFSVSAALAVDGGVGVLAQSVPGLSDTYLMQLAEKGGGWVVLLIVLFFYRRDYQRLTASESVNTERLMTAIEKQAESEQQLAIALAENTEVIRNLRQ
jgi:hypothetical protein